MGTMAAPHQMLALQKEEKEEKEEIAHRGWMQGTLLSDLQQSVPQIGRVHLHILESRPPTSLPELATNPRKAVLQASCNAVVAGKLVDVLWLCRSTATLPQSSCLLQT